MINKENQTPNNKISYIYSVINMTIVDSNRIREIMLTKSAFKKKNTHDPIREKVKEYMEVVSNLCHYKEQFVSLKFDDKIRLAKLLIEILRFSILKQCDMRSNAKFVNAMINNSTFLILGLKEVSITIDYAFHLIEYFQQQDLNILQNSCDQIIRNLDQIKLDRKQLNRSALPEITVQLENNQETMIKNLFYEICVQISNTQLCEDHLDFLQHSIWSPTYYVHKCIQKVYSQKIMQLFNPFERLCFLIKLCIQRPSNEVKQVIAFIIRKCYNQSSHINNICQCTKLCLQMYISNSQCRKNNEIIDSIIRLSIQLNFIAPIQVIVQNWKYNQNFLFEVCQLYVKITKSHTLQDLSNYLSEINYIQSLQTMEDYKYFVLKILKYYEQNRSYMYNRFKSSLNIFRLFDSILSNNLNLQEQKNKLIALICYSNLLKILKLEQSAENVVVQTSFLIVMQTLLIIRMGFVDSLKISQLQPYFQKVIKSSSKNVKLYYYCFLQSICKIFKAENQTKNSLKIIRKIMNNMIQSSITNIDSSLDCVFSSIDKGEIKLQKQKVIQSIISYVQNNLKNSISSTVGSVIAKLIVSSKIILKSKKISQQIQSLLTQSSFHQNIESHFINTFEKQMYEVVNNIMCNVKLIQNNQNKINLFLDIFQIYRQRFFLRLQKSTLYYTHYYQTVSDFINKLSQLSYYYAKKKTQIGYLSIAIQKLKLSLVVNQKYSPYDMFRNMNDNFKQYSLPHYVNVFAKQIHLLAINQGQATLSTSQEGQFQQFSLKSRNIIKQLSKIAQYLTKQLDITNTYGIINIIKLPIGNIKLPSSFNVHDLKSMITNLDTIIYYCQALSSKHLQLFVGIKVSAILIHYPNKQFSQLKQQTKLRVLSQLLPLIRTNKNYKRWVRQELKLLTIKDKQAQKLLQIMKLYVLDSLTQNQQEVSDDKIVLIQASDKMGQSIVFGKQVLRQLMARVIQTLKGAYQQALENNSLRVVKLPATQRIPNHLLFETISLFIQQSELYQPTMFPFEDMFDYDRAFCHILPDHFVKLIKLMYNKNQISEVKRIFPFAFKVLLKSFNINGIFQALTYIYKNYKVQSIFDSSLGIFKQMGINIDRLETIRKKIFDRRRSMVCKYTIHKLGQDFSKVFNDIQLHQVTILQHFAKIILKYFGQTNFVDGFTTSINISKIFKHQINPLLLKIFNHLHNNLLIKKPEVLEIKFFLLSQIMKYINYDFEKAMQYKNVLGIIHQSCFDSLLSQEQILQIGFNIIELNYIYKERMLLQQKDKNYFQDLTTSYEFFKQNDQAFKIRSIQKNLNTMLSIVKKQGYPFVMIFPFGNQLAVCIITTSIKIKMVDLNQFKDVNKITKDIIRDNNQRIDNFNDIPKKVWWQNRINLDSRLQKNISSYSQIDNFNFYTEIFNQYSEQEKKQFQILLLVQDSLQNAPYECMNEQGPKKGVYRVPSLSYLFKTLRARQKSTVNMANLTYLVDPQNNLQPTQTRFKQMKKQYSLWQGIIAKKPNHQEFFQLLKSDVFMFMGHGQGKYIQDHELYDKTTNTIPLIYGCSSVRLVEQDTESHGFALSYLLSGCPLLLGCLWNVTDKDVDKLTSTMITKFRYGKIDLGKTVQQSKSSCNLKYINGAAVILYGLPHKFCYKE